MAGNLSAEDATRLVDFVNDKIQSIEDLQSLDTLLQSLQEQQDIQRQQLREAEEILKNATKASKEHAEAVRKEAEAFKQHQADIDRRLLVVTQSEHSDEAVRKFEDSIARLQRLDVSQGYLELLSSVDQLNKDAMKTMKSSPHDALRSYAQLRSIETSISTGQDTVEGATPYLLDYVTKVSGGLKDSIRVEYTDKLQNILDKMKWPMKELPTESLIDEWMRWCDLLLEFQEPDLTSVTIKKGPGDQSDLLILLPLEVMSRPLELRFKYHFSGDRPTNRLDKPEYFMSHVLDLINTHAEFFSTYLQPILNKRALNGTPLLRSLYSDAVSSFISSLLPMVRQKALSLLPTVSKHPQAFSHLIHELMNFDNELKSSWSYPSNAMEENAWKGITWEILTKESWFSEWLQVEKNFALARYQSIIDAEDSGEIDYDGVAPTATKPTKAALRVNDLLENVTELYRPLSSFSQKLRFLIDIQIAIFDLFHGRLHSGLEAYLAMTSAIGRTVQGSSAGQPNLDGVSGLERLCRIFGSAEYLEKKMQDWGDDVFFLELWYELQDRVARQGQTGKPVAGALSVSEIAARTSSSVTNNNHDHTSDAAEGALFDETAAAYRRLRMRSESIIQSTIASNVQASLRPYYQVSTWASLRSSSDDSSTPTTPSLDLVQTLRLLTADFSFLSRTLAIAPRRRVANHVLLAIQTYIWDSILMRNSFSTSGAAQLFVDISNICDTVDTAIGVKAGEELAARTMKKLRDGLFVLNLEIKAGKDQPLDASDAAGTALGLWEAEKRLFANNESARGVLSELCIDTLTEADARSVLERRVEVRS
ncbi:RINT-1 family protein [Trichophyton violaceum]|uniref:RINT-1 family protein n=1 Tax=Trichophyton violaceum TaxID=34388 RepID=A0A178FMV7_TRIVO|nr:RINT-1 family protein [Trichophyton violaceum]